MISRCFSFVAGLTALVSLAQGQVAPHSSLAESKAVKQTWTPPLHRRWTS